MIPGTSLAPIKAGDYEIHTGEKMQAIFKKLQKGHETLFRATIPEGLTIKKTALILEELGICSADDFAAASEDTALLGKHGIKAKSAEGFLFPDTYYFPKNYSGEKAVDKMISTFFEKLSEIYDELNTENITDTGSRPVFSAPPAVDPLLEKVILASIVEREYRLESEAPLIAGVFQNRLDINMALESCATVEYVITEIMGKPHPTRLFNRDIEIDNPYNTYVYRGLPPGPIANPGLVSLKAALKPEHSKYLFFRVSGGGGHYFSETFDQHIKAGELLLK
jgi:UPF0755 protein